MGGWKRLAPTLALLLVVTACADKSPFGNFADDKEFSGVDQVWLAGDAATQMIEMYPPAKTHLHFVHSTPDPFGVALLRILRESGYAVREYNTDDHGADEPDGLALRYVLAPVNHDKASMILVTLLVGKVSVARPYTNKSGLLAPAGFWVRGDWSEEGER